MTEDSARNISDLERRLTDLEIRLTHAQHLCDELSDVVAEQGRTIDRLALENRHLAGRLRSQEERIADRSPADDRPPPHY